MNVGAAFIRFAGDASVLATPLCFDTSATVVTPACGYCTPSSMPLSCQSERISPAVRCPRRRSQAAPSKSVAVTRASAHRVASCRSEGEQARKADGSAQSLFRALGAVGCRGFVIAPLSVAQGAIFITTKTRDIRLDDLIGLRPTGRAQAVGTGWSGIELSLIHI